jgi:hypothetical protein
LSELPAALLQALCWRPWRFDRLCAELAGLCEIDNDIPWQKKIAGLLATLAELELVEQRANALSTDGPGHRNPPP